MHEVHSKLAVVDVVMDAIGSDPTSTRAQRESMPHLGSDTTTQVESAVQTCGCVPAARLAGLRTGQSVSG